MINHLDDVHFNRVKGDNWKGMFHFLNFITLLVDITRQIKYWEGQNMFLLTYLIYVFQFSVFNINEGLILIISVFLSLGYE